MKTKNYTHRERGINLIGSKFIHHDPFKLFQVETTKKHFITESLDNFEIDDKLYETKLFYKPDNILVWALNNDQKTSNVIYWNLGKGKFYYITLGHDGRAWDNSSFKKMLCRSILWAKQ